MGCVDAGVLIIKLPILASPPRNPRVLRDTEGNTTVLVNYVQNVELQTVSADSELPGELIKNRDSPGPRRSLVEPGNMYLISTLFNSGNVARFGCC